MQFRKVIAIVWIAEKALLAHLTYFTIRSLCVWRITIGFAAAVELASLRGFSFMDAQMTMNFLMKSAYIVRVNSPPKLN